MQVYSGEQVQTVSEKYDGICAYWDGHRLTTRDGNVLHAPAWFTAGLPDCALVGELWAGRGRFEAVLSICTARDAGDRWRDVRYMVFCGPDGIAVGEHAEHVQRWPAVDVDADRDRIIAAGGEGVVVRSTDGVDYKYKLVSDDDAVVIGHTEGSGRNAGRCGALVVRDRDGREFKLGTMPDSYRDTPPPVGSVVEFEFQGRTRHGKPRFASFLRVRAEQRLVG